MLLGPLSVRSEFSGSAACPLVTPFRNFSRWSGVENGWGRKRWSPMPDQGDGRVSVAARTGRSQRGECRRHSSRMALPISLYNAMETTVVAPEFFPDI
jgi:hypothetical protein